MAAGPPILDHESVDRALRAPGQDCGYRCRRDDGYEARPRQRFERPTGEGLGLETGEKVLSTLSALDVDLQLDRLVDGQAIEDPGIARGMPAPMNTQPTPASMAP